MGRCSPHTRSRLSTLGAFMAVDSPTSFIAVKTILRPHNRAVRFNWTETKYWWLVSKQCLSEGHSPLENRHLPSTILPDRCSNEISKLESTERVNGSHSSSQVIRVMGYDVSHNPEERKTYILHTRCHAFVRTHVVSKTNTHHDIYFLVVAETTLLFSTAESFYPDQIKTK